MIATWDRPGDVDLLEFFAELTIYTSSACLIGKKFRESLDGRFAQLFHDLERGTDAMAFVDPYADIESFHRRDAARVEMNDTEKVTVLTRYWRDKETGVVWFAKSCSGVLVKPGTDTEMRLYPLAVMQWKKRSKSMSPPHARSPRVACNWPCPPAGA